MFGHECSVIEDGNSGKGPEIVLFGSFASTVREWCITIRFVLDLFIPIELGHLHLRSRQQHMEKRCIPPIRHKVRNFRQCRRYFRTQITVFLSSTSNYIWLSKEEGRLSHSFTGTRHRPSPSKTSWPSPAGFLHRQGHPRTLQ